MAKKEKIEILVVEDSPTQAEKLKYILEHHDYRIRSASNGQEALEMIAARRPAIVITDIVMPKMDGFQLCGEIRKNERFKDIPVILLTALSGPEDVLKGLESGGDGFITKPYDEEYLLERINHVLVNAEMRKAGKDNGEISFKGNIYNITSRRMQILDLLISTYETAVIKNRELKKAQKEMLELNERLQEEINRGRRREEEIKNLNESLRRRAIELEQVNRDLESFSYSISHDLKAPLRAIGSFSQILADEYSDKFEGECGQMLKSMEENAKRMSQLIDDMLAFARAGREEIRVTDIDPKKIIEKLIAESAPSFSGRAVRFELKELPHAAGDLAMLNQVFLNLISNAIKFTRPRDPALIEIGGRDAGDEIIYYVKDNGVGFNSRLGHKLFGVFQRLHVQGDFEGTGIGLAIVKRIVNKLGGRIWAEGKTNEGATIYFSLPKKPVD